MTRVQSLFPALLGAVLALVMPVPGSAQVSVSLPEVAGGVGSRASIPIATSDLSGQGVLAYLFTVSYDPEILQVTGVSTEGTLAADMAVEVNSNTPGEVVIAASSATVLEGAGILLNLEVEYTGGGTTSLSWENFVFNEEGSLAATLVDGSATGEGEVVVNEVWLGGLAAEDWIELLVVDDHVDLRGYQVLDAADGSQSGFTFGQDLVWSDLRSGTLIAIGGAEAGITVDANPLDFSISIRAQSSLLATASFDLSRAAGGVQILRPQGENVFGLSWGAASAGLLPGIHVDLEGDAVADGSALAYQEGTAEGLLLATNWAVQELGTLGTNNSLKNLTWIGALRLKAGGGVLVTLPELGPGQVRDLVQVSVQVGDLTGQDVFSYFFTLAYDLEVVRINSVSTEGTLSENMTIEANADLAGQITVAAFQIRPLEGVGTLLNFDLEYIGRGDTDLKWVDFSFNEGEPRAGAIDGKASVRINLEEGIAVSLADAAGLVGDTVQLPIAIGDVSGQDIFAYQFTLRYDADILKISGVSTEGTISAGMDVQGNEIAPGEFIVAASQAAAMEGEGILLFLEAEYIGGGTTPLRWRDFIFNERNPLPILTDSQVSVDGELVLNEVHNGPSPSVDWVELLVVADHLDLRLYQVADLEGSGFTFADDALWADMRRGTLIVIGGQDAPLREDVDPENFIISIRNDPLAPSLLLEGDLLDLGALEDGVRLLRADAEHAFAVFWGGSGEVPAFSVDLAAGPLPANANIDYLGANLAGIVDVVDWNVAEGNPGTPGKGNSESNANWITDLRGGADVVSEIDMPGIDVVLPEVMGQVGTRAVVPVRVGDVTGRQVFSYFFTIEYDPEVLKIEGTSSGGLVEQYASSLIDFSSQFGTNDWAATQTLGEPNTSSYGDIATAWAPGNQNGTQENITVGFETPVFATGVVIRETFGNGYVLQVEVLSENDSYSTVWTGTDTSQPGSPVDFQVSWPQTDFKVKGVRITIDTDNTSGWEEMDAVQLQGTLSRGSVTSISQGMTILANTSVSGQITVAASGITPLEGEGNLTFLDVEYVGPGVADLRFRNFAFNEGIPEAFTQDGNAAVRVGATEGVTLSLPEATGQIGDTVSWQIAIDDVTGLGILSYLLAISYDADVLNITGISTAGTLSADMSVEANTSVPGKVTVAASHIEALAGSGGLLTLETEYVGRGTSALRWANLIFNEGDVEGMPIDGKLTVQNDALTAVADELAAEEDTPTTLDVLANDVDPADDPLRLEEIVDEPVHGTIVIDPDSLSATYTPEADYNGLDSLTYAVTDGLGDVDTTAVAIAITPVNDPPVGVENTTTTLKDSIVTIFVLANDADIDGDPLTVSGVAQPVNGTAAVNPGDISISYTPDAGFIGVDLFRYELSDGQGGTDSSSVTVNVLKVNEPPVLVDDVVETAEDTPVTVAVLANDTEPDGDPMTLVEVTQPERGIATIDPGDSTVTYTPPADYNGEDSFTYTVSDDKEQIATASVIVTVSPVNDLPQPVDDAETTAEEVPVTVAMLANDADVDGDELAIAEVSQGTSGTVAIDVGGTSVTYTPNENYNGTDRFTYTLSDNQGGLATGNVAITVTPVNDLPLAVDDVVTTDEDVAAVVNILANDSDVDADALTVTAVVDAANGTVAIGADGASVAYTPSADYNGEDSFTYAVEDGQGGSSTGTVTVTVNPVNDLPVVLDDAVETDEDTPISVAVLANDRDVDGDALVVTAATDGTNGTVSIDAAGVSVTYTPSADYNGEDRFTYAVEDGQGGSATGTVTVTVNPINDLPVVLDDAVETDEDVSVVVSVLANDSDVDGDALTVTAVTVGSNGTVSIDADGVSVTYTPSADYNGEDRFTYTVEDGQGGSATGTVTVTVNPINDLPVVLDDAVETDEDVSVVVSVLANDSDVDGDVLTVTSATDGSNGTVSIDADGASVTYTPSADYNGEDSFTYAVEDGRGGSATGTVTVTVNPINDLPVVLDDAVETDEDVSIVVSVLANDSDVDGDVLTVTSATDGANGTVGIDAGGASVTYTPSTDYNGDDRFTYTVEDGQGGSATGTVTVTVNPVNDLPIVLDDAVETDEDTPVSVAVLANASDVDGDVLTVTSATDGANGTVSIDAGGASVTYTPSADYNGEDSFTYAVEDGQGGSSTGTVTVTVNPVNDLPVVLDDAVEADEDVSVIVSVLANDSDVDGDVLTVTSVTNASNGTVTLDADNGSVAYSPSADYNGEDSFTYTVEDGQGGSSTGTMTVTVRSINDLPVVLDDAVESDEDTPASVAVLANDSDVDGDVLTVAAVTDGANGTVSIDADGTSVTYTPSVDYNGPDSFTYTVEDGQGGSSTGTVTMTVNPINDLPVALDDAVETDEDVSVIVSVLANDSDVDGDVLTMTAVTDASNGTVTIDADGASVTYTPSVDYNGPDSFTYTVEDGQGGSSTGTVTVTVNSINDLPVVLDDAVETDEDTSISVAVLANDSDVDGDALVVASTTDASNGTVTIDADGASVTYTPSANYNGEDSFTYTVEDGQGGSSTGTVTVTVTDINDAPVTANDAIETAEDTGISIPVLDNDTDAEDDLLAIVDVTQPANGAVEISGPIAAIYTPAANYNGADSFTYTIDDGNGGKATGNVNITVTPVNDPPTPFVHLTPEDGDVLARDSVRFSWTASQDVDGDDLSYSVFIAVGDTSSLDTSFVQETTQTFLEVDFLALDLPMEQVTVFWGLGVSDSDTTVLIVDENGIVLSQFLLEELKAELVLSATELDFGTVAIGQSETRSLTLENRGNSELSVTGLSYSDGQSSNADSSFSVAPGASLSVDVVFTPLLPDAQAGTLTIASNDPANPSVVVQLVGIGSGKVVWPGDTTDDKVVDGRDILPIGIFWQLTGPSRPVRDTGWAVQGVASWSEERAVFADADGNGVVDEEDILPVAQNWRLSRTSEKVLPDEGIDPVALPDTLQLHILRAMVRVLDEAPPADGVREVRALLQRTLERKMLPRQYRLLQNTPNPFNPSTAIRFEVPTGERGHGAILQVYDITGQVVRTYALEEVLAGQHEVVWDGRDVDGRDVASGVYLYRLQVGNFTAVRRMLLLR